MTLGSNTEKRAGLPEIRLPLISESGRSGICALPLATSLCDPKTYAADQVHGTL